MTNEENFFEVIWGQGARVQLAKMKPFKVNPRLVFEKTGHLLSHKPRKTAYDVVDSPNSRYNGYYWTLINNVILVYIISETDKNVFILASFFANTAWAHQLFWGIEPEDYK